MSVALCKTIVCFPVTIRLCYCVCSCAVCFLSVSSRWRRPGWHLLLPTSSSVCRCCCCPSLCSGSPNLSCMASSSILPSPPSTETRCATAWLSSSRSRWERERVCVRAWSHMSVTGILRSNVWLDAQSWRSRPELNNICKYTFFVSYKLLRASGGWVLVNQTEKLKSKSTGMSVLFLSCVRVNLLLHSTYCHYEELNHFPLLLATSHTSAPKWTR